MKDTAMRDPMRRVDSAPRPADPEEELEVESPALAVEDVSKRRHDHEAQGAASGAIAGGVMGTAAGPVGIVAGAVIGGIAGALAGKVLDQEAERKAQRLREMDAELGIIEGELGAPTLDGLGASPGRTAR